AEASGRDERRGRLGEGLVAAQGPRMSVNRGFIAWPCHAQPDAARDAVVAEDQAFGDGAVQTRVPPPGQARAREDPQHAVRGSERVSRIATFSSERGHAANEPRDSR